MKNLLNRKSFKWQLLSKWILTLIVLLIIIGATQSFAMKKYLAQSKYQIIEARFNAFNQNRGKGHENLISVDAIINMVQDRNSSAALIDQNGQIIGESKDAKGIIITPHLTEEQYKEELILDKPKSKYRIVEDNEKNESMVAIRKILLPNGQIGLLQISTSLTPEHHMLLNQNLIFIAASIIVIVIGTLICSAVIGHVLKPLYNMTHTIKDLSIKELNVRLPESTGQMEIDSLSEAFNGMLGRIETSFEKEQYINEKMKRFVSDASHEMRTPLTSIHGFVEVLLRGAAKNEQQLDLALNSILTESERLTELINELLMLTKLDQQTKLELNNENLKVIIEELQPQLKILAGERNLCFELKDNLYSMVNKNQIKQVILNIIQNAIQHTEERSGEITVTLEAVDRPRGSCAVLAISDNGTGIPKEDLTEIFNRFFRSETHRSRKHGGYGLGLSIVHSIVKAHEGEIYVTSQVGEGTSFQVFLPLVIDNM